MKCPKCETPSKVYPGLCYSTLMYCQPYYDEAGVYHHHDLNTNTQEFSCSNGHSWVTKGNSKCPGCDWGSDSEVVLEETAVGNTSGVVRLDMNAGLVGEVGAVSLTTLATNAEFDSSGSE